MMVRDGNDAARAMYDRHYSRRRYLDGRRPLKIVGPGQYLVLMHASGRALFIWRKFIDDSGQTGVNCAAFRNEGAGISSDLNTPGRRACRRAMARRASLYLRRPEETPAELEPRLLLPDGGLAALRADEKAKPANT